MQRKKTGCLPVIMAVCIAVILSVCKLYKDDLNGFEEVKDEVVSENKKDKKEDGLSIKWDKLPDDCVAWVYFKAPEIISYPVMQSADNDYYLHRNIKGKYSFAGSIFMDYNNHSDFSDQNTIIYGHNMATGTMFGSLKEFKEKSYWKKHNTFEIYTRDGRRLTYKIYNSVIVSPSSDIYTYQFGSEESMNSYIKTWTENGLYSTDIMPDHNDHIVSLSTCQYRGTKRLVVQGYLIKEEMVEE